MGNHNTVKGLDPREFDQLTEAEIVMLTPRDLVKVTGEQFRQAKRIRDQYAAYRRAELASGKADPRITPQMRAVLRWDKPRR